MFFNSTLFSSEICAKIRMLPVDCQFYSKRDKKNRLSDSLTGRKGGFLLLPNIQIITIKKSFIA